MFVKHDKQKYVFIMQDKLMHMFITQDKTDVDVYFTRQAGAYDYIMQAKLIIFLLYMITGVYVIQDKLLHMFIIYGKLVYIFYYAKLTCMFLIHD